MNKNDPVKTTSLKNRIYPSVRDVPVLPDAVVVKFKKAYPGRMFESSLEECLRRIGTLSTNHEFVSHRDDGTELSKIFRIALPAGSDVYQTIDRLNREPSVIWAEPLYFKQTCYEPNDSYINSQWYLAKIQAREAWDHFKGDPAVLIGIVDTGVNYEHPDLAANIWINPNEVPDNNTDDDGNNHIDDWRGWDVADDDNDPYPSPVSSSSNKYHGTMVAGVASCVTDNGIGIAAPAFNAKILAVKATQDSDPTQQGIINTHLGIVYAADMGADIVNCSFRGGASNAEWEAVNYANSLGVLIVAAAGNDGLESPFYPANYPGVLSVAATNSSDIRAIFNTLQSSNFGYWVDVSAPGMDMYSTCYSASYATWNGTSFACPLTASLAALVLGNHPDWSGQRAAQQVRISADPIDDLKPEYKNKLGRGRINANRALTYSSPAVRIDAIVQEEGDGSNQNGLLDPGEEALITFTVKNYFMSIDQMSLTFTTDNPLAILTGGNFSGIHLDEMESWSNTGDPIRIQVDSEAERGQTIGVFCAISGSSGYQDYDYFEVELPNAYGTLKGANVQVTVTPDGNFGYADYSENLMGVGFVFGQYNGLLFEGAVMAGTDALHVSDAARGENEQFQNEDFVLSVNGELVIRRPGPLADEQGEAIFNDEITANPIHLEVDQSALAFYDTLYGDFILLHYKLSNLSSGTIQNLHFGLFMDWDVGQDPNTDSGSNLAGFDPAFDLGYIYKDESSLYCGLQVLSEGGATIYRCVDNAAEIYNGYADSEKWAHLSGGIQDNLGDAENDYSHVVGVGPFDITANEPIVVGFAVLGGESLSDLKRNAGLAKAKWQSVYENTGIDPGHENQLFNFRLMENYPNPFNGSTVISYDLPVKSLVLLTVHDLQGREIARIFNQPQEAGHHAVEWNGFTQEGPAASGVYLYRIQAGTFARAGKMTLLK